MKRSIVAVILGVAATVTAYAQGHCSFSNYLTPSQSQIVWGSEAPPGRANQAVNATDGLQFQLYFGEGVLTWAQLTPGEIFSIEAGVDTYVPSGGTHGPGGYFLNVIQVLPTWAAGDVFTFGYRPMGAGNFGDSPLWQESASIVPSGEAPNSSSLVPGLTVVVPEPSTLALAGVGSAALLLFRRRKA